jgi:hypothetical protein
MDYTIFDAIHDFKNDIKNMLIIKLIEHTHIYAPTVYAMIYRVGAKEVRTYTQIVDDTIWDDPNVTKTENM